MVTTWPTEETTEDFWKMIFDTKASSIIILCETPSEERRGWKVGVDGEGNGLSERGVVSDEPIDVESGVRIETRVDQKDKVPHELVEYPIFWPEDKNANNFKTGKNKTFFGQMSLEEVEREMTESVSTQTLLLSKSCTIFVNCLRSAFLLAGHFTSI